MVLAFVVALMSWATTVVSQENAFKPARTPDGQPDMQGSWGSAETGIYSLNLEPLPHLRKLGMPPMPPGLTSASGDPVDMIAMTAYAKGKSLVVDPPTGVIPHQPWALERRNSVMKNYDSPEPWQIDTQTRGWPNGIPRIHVYSTVDGTVGGPWQVLQGPGFVLFLYETQHEFRYVPLNARPQPGRDIKLWMGSSRGRWDGNTLVIETTNNNDSPRLDVVGNFRSDEMRVTERFTLIDKDTLEYRATLDDPKVYTRPWTIAITNKRAPADIQLFEYAGVEGDLNAGLATEQTLENDKAGSSEKPTR